MWQPGSTHPLFGEEWYPPANACCSWVVPVWQSAHLVESVLTPSWHAVQPKVLPLWMPDTLFE
jgi:hypothetical protein